MHKNHRRKTKESIIKRKIKSCIPTYYFDDTELNGISLREHSYSLFKGDDSFYVLLTRLNDPLIDILRGKFIVEYSRPFWLHYVEYRIYTSK